VDEILLARLLQPLSGDDWAWYQEQEARMLRRREERLRARDRVMMAQVDLVLAVEDGEPRLMQSREET
jgi:hypothetical protein